MPLPLGRVRGGCGRSGQANCCLAVGLSTSQILSGRSRDRRLAELREAVRAFPVGGSPMPSVTYPATIPAPGPRSPSPAAGRGLKISWRIRREEFQSLRFINDCPRAKDGILVSLRENGMPLEVGFIIIIEVSAANDSPTSFGFRSVKHPPSSEVLYPEPE